MRLRDLSLGQEREGRSPEAADTVRRAVAILEGVLADFPNDAKVRFVYPYVLADYLERLGDLLRDTGGLEGGEKVCVRALDLAQQQMRRAPSPHSFWQIVSLHNGLGTVRLDAGRLAAAKQDFERALALMEKVPDSIARSPGSSAFLLTGRSRCHVGLGNVLFESGKPDESVREFAAARQDYEAMLKPNRGVPDPARRYAWFLLTCPVRELRDPKRALDLVRGELNRLEKGDPEWAASLKLVRLATYRAGDWKGSLDYPSMHVPHRAQDGWFWLVQGMARWQLGDAKAARESYDAGVAWTEKNRPTDLDLRRLRAEAAALLGVQQKRD
jgi:tetratricopeptide (TPR) repeat protein